ncbi:hypothetical protein DVH24_029147 [Malus domestica]|uniref:Uncharacterized protein n=1 Tax=Malus domestica TaxID=3750 RepID=A0A498HSL0_MALDO|nr:hypothetical protein DVH24_029147 [Malus domestica]
MRGIVVKKIIILCSTGVKRVVLGGKVKRKSNQIWFCGTACSTVFGAPNVGRNASSHCVLSQRVVLGGEVERKFTKNSFRETARSIRFRHTKRGTESPVPLRSVSSHVPNRTFRNTNILQVECSQLVKVA